MFNLLKVVFRYALSQEYILRNPMDFVLRLPKPNSNLAYMIYSKEDILKIEKRLETTNLQIAFKLGVNLGLRAGECFGLRWSDIDFESNTVSINKQLQKVDRAWCFTQLKTERSYRVIKFGDKFKEYLINQKEKQEQNKIYFGKLYKENLILDLTQVGKQELLSVDDLINIKDDGKMLNSDSQKVISRICKNELGIDFKFSNLRHTHATLLASMNVDPEFARVRLGHTKITTTLRYYVHATSPIDESIANKVDDIIN